MTLEQAAQVLGLSVSTLRNQARAGKLRTQRVGARVQVVTPAEVERYRSEHLGKRKGGPKPKKRT